MKAPKHTFPCDYIVKIVGENHDTFERDVLSIIKSETTIKEQSLTKSNNNRYLSLSVTMALENEAALENIYGQLKDKPYIKMIL
jgi:putative lipoic acid-binding regulatory protein